MSRKFTSLKTKIAKTLLVLIGSVLAVSVAYRHVLQGFLLNDTPHQNWGINDTVLLCISFFLMLGATYYDKVVGALFSFFDKFLKR